jgi:hypothetical protein
VEDGVLTCIFLKEFRNYKKKEIEISGNDRRNSEKCEELKIVS